MNSAGVRVKTKKGCCYRGRKLLYNLVKRPAFFLYFCNKSGFRGVFISEQREKHPDMAKSEQLERIIQGCRKGDSQCFSELVDAYAGRCYGYFYRLCGDRTVSDDLLGELFVRIVEKIKSYKGGSFDGWLFTVASNIFHDYLRDKQRREKLLQGHKEILETRSKKMRRYNDERSDKLQNQLEKLDDDTRELIMLRFYSQVSFGQLAAMRNEPIGTTLSKVHRGLKKLRGLMGQK